MSRLAPRRTAPLALGGAALLAVAACGSGGGSKQSASAANPSGQQAAAMAAANAAQAGKAKTGGLTPPGTDLRLGSSASVAWVPPSGFTTAKAQAGIRLVVSVDSIEKGSIADFKNIQLDPSQRASTPYYVKVHLRNVGSTGPSSDNPGLAFQAIDDRGQQQQSVTFIGDFPRCSDSQPPKPFSNGKSYSTCLTYLLPGGGSINEVHWNDGPSRAGAVSSYFDKPVVWKGAS